MTSGSEYLNDALRSMLERERNIIDLNRSILETVGKIISRVEGSESIVIDSSHSNAFVRRRMELGVIPYFLPDYELRLMVDRTDKDQAKGGWWLRSGEDENFFGIEAVERVARAYYCAKTAPPQSDFITFRDLVIGGVTEEQMSLIILGSYVRQALSVRRLVV